MKLTNGLYENITYDGTIKVSTFFYETVRKTANVEENVQIFGLCKIQR